MSLLVALSLIFCEVTDAAQHNATKVMAGFTIEQIDGVFDTELRSDFGFPLSEAMSEEQWVEAKKLKWSIVNEANETTFFPFLCCNAKGLEGSAAHYQELKNVLITSAEAVQYPTYYTSPIDDSPTPEGQTRVVLEPLRASQNITCFLTSMTNDIAMHAVNDPMTEYMVFQPITQSLNMVRGTIDTLKAVMNGLYDDLPNPRLFTQTCPHVVDTYTPDEYLSDLKSMMTKTSANGPHLVTQLNYFYKKVENKTAEKNGGLDILLDVSRRALFYTEHLQLGVENGSTNSCSDAMNDLEIVNGGNNDYFVTIEEANFSEYDEAGKSCLMSILIAMAEMPTICSIQVRFPNSAINPSESEGGTSSAYTKLSSRQMRARTMGPIMALLLAIYLI